MAMIPRNRSLVASSSVPTMLWCPHPLTASGRETFNAAFFKGESIAAYLSRLDARFADRPVSLYVNDVQIERTEWPITFPAQGDTITVRALVHGGGDDKNKVARTMLSLAVIYFAAPALAGGIGLTGTKLAVGKALISMGGLMIVNALLPPPTQRLADAQGDDDSPTYSLSGGANRPRLMGPMPIVIGEHRIYPDLGAREYTELVGTDQYLYGIYNYGLSDMTLSDTRIGDTPLSNFSDISQEESVGATINLFPGNVDSLAVGVSLDSNPNLVTNGNFDDGLSNWNVNGDVYTNGGQARFGGDDYGIISQNITVSAGNSYLVAFNLIYAYGGVVASVGGTSGVLHSTVGLKTETIVAGSGGSPTFRLTNDTDSTIAYIDNVVVSELPLWATRTSSLDTVKLSIDITGYLFYAGNNGIESHSVTLEMEYRPVGGSWVPFVGSSAAVVITNSDRAPVRLTYSREVQKGQYDIRLRRVSAADSNTTKFTSDITWSVLRSYQSDDADYSGQHRLALSIRASGQLQGRIDALNSIATAECEAWTGAAWVRQPTSNPAWWFRWFAIGKLAANGRRMFGADIQDARIDIEAVKEWGAWCDSKGLEVNLVLDRKTSVFETLTIIARMGRATVSWASGKLGVIWDADNQPVIQQFGMGNIIRDTFKISYVTGSLADAIEVEFINPALNWQPDVVLANTPGVTSPINIAKIQLMGCTSKIQAEKEALLLAAQQYYRRRRVEWESDFEGMVVQRGDVVTVSHDLTSWGYSGRLESGTINTLVLDREVPFTPATTHYIGIRYPDGTYEVNAVDYQVGPSNVITLTTPLTAAPDNDPDGNYPVDYLWFFEPEATPGKKLKILDVRPVSDKRVRLTATDEDPAYYASELGSGVYVNPSLYSNFYPSLSNLEVSDTLIRVGSSFAVNITMAWDVSGDYGGAWVRWRAPGESWRPMMGGVGAIRTFEFQGPVSGLIDIEITGFNNRGRSGANSTLSAAYTIVGKAALPDPVDTFTVTRQANGDHYISIEYSNKPVDFNYFVLEVEGTATHDHFDSFDFISDTAALKTPGTYNISVYVVDTSGNISDPITLPYTRTQIEDVPTIRATQSGSGLADMRWPATSDIGRDGAKIAYGKVGSAWEDKAVISDGERGINKLSADIPPGVWEVGAKYVDTNGNESINQTVDQLEIVSKNVDISKQYNAPAWAGTLTRFIKHWTGVLVPDSTVLASDMTDAQLWDEAVYSPFSESRFLAPELDAGFDDIARMWYTLDAYLAPGSTGQISTAVYLDYRLDGDSYDGGEIWTIGEREGRYFQFEIVQDNAKGIGIISQFDTTVDNVEETVIVRDFQFTTPGPTPIVFPRQFHSLPRVTVAKEGTSGYDVYADNLTVLGADLYLLDKNDVDIQLVRDVFITGN